jgi:hypothetical protein
MSGLAKELTKYVYLWCPKKPQEADGRNFAARLKVGDSK